MVVVGIIISSAGTWQDVVDPNFLQTGEPENRGRDSHSALGSAHMPRMCSVGIGKWGVAPPPLSDVRQVIWPLRTSVSSRVKWG